MSKYAALVDGSPRCVDCHPGCGQCVGAGLTACTACAENSTQMEERTEVVAILAEENGTAVFINETLTVLTCQMIVVGPTKHR